MNMLSKNRKLLCVIGILLIGCVVFMAFPFYEATPPPSPPLTRTYADLEQSLCKNDIETHDARNIIQCPEQGIITVREGGRLGNQMWTYITVLAYARIKGLKPYLTKCVRSQMAEMFEQLSIPDLEEIAHCPVNLDEKYVGFSEDWSYTNKSLIILPKYNRKAKFLLRWRDEILREFKFNENLTENAKKILTGFARNLPAESYTFIAVHVRRTDFIKYMRSKYGHSAASRQFYFNAMKYYEDKYLNCLFIFISDDPDWCHQEFGNHENIYVTSYKTGKVNTPAEDMAIMAACNHSIIDYGTYGEWGAILANGETVYCNLTVNTHASLPGWIMINN